MSEAVPKAAYNKSASHEGSRKGEGIFCWLFLGWEFKGYILLYKIDIFLFIFFYFEFVRF